MNKMQNLESLNINETDKRIEEMDLQLKDLKNKRNKYCEFDFPDFEFFDDECWQDDLRMGFLHPYLLFKSCGGLAVEMMEGGFVTVIPGILFFALSISFLAISTALLPIYFLHDYLTMPIYYGIKSAVYYLKRHKIDKKIDNIKNEKEELFQKKEIIQPTKVTQNNKIKNENKHSFNKENTKCNAIKKYLHDKNKIDSYNKNKKQKNESETLEKMF